MPKFGNPFIYSGPVPPSHFVGREQGVGMIFDLIAKQGGVAVSGEQRIGRTSLLHYIADPDIAKVWGLTPDRYILLYLDCQSISDFTSTRFWQRVLDLLSRQVGANELRGAIEQLCKQKEIHGADLEPILDGIHGQEQTLVLLLDEFEWVIRTDTDKDMAITCNFLSELRALFSHVPRAFSLIVATCERLDTLCRPIKFIASPFYTCLASAFLKPFTREEAEELIDRALEGTGVEFSKRDRDFVFEASKGHPYWLQNACFKLFQKKLELLK